jgi:superfamily II DNA/RNA helicase
VDAVERVLHFDPANDAKTHLHRSGRTGRAGADGTVVTLVLPDQTRDVERLLREAGTPAEDLLVGPRDMTSVVPAPVEMSATERPAPNRRPDAGPRPDGMSRGSYASGRRAPRGSRPVARRPQNAA